MLSHAKIFLTNVLKPLQPDIAFLCTPIRFSDVFREYKKASPDCNGLRNKINLKLDKNIFTNFDSSILGYARADSVISRFKVVCAQGLL